MTPLLTLFRFTFHAMACQNEIQLYAESPARAQALSELAIQEVQRIESKYSRYRAESALSHINAQAGDGIGVTVDDETAALLDFSAVLHRESDGLFDLTSGVLRRVWNFTAAKLPTTAELDAILPLVGWEKISWRRPRLDLPEKGMELDFGGIGKEYAADRAAALLQAQGVAGALVNLGGDVRVIGARPNHTSWQVGIAHPRRFREILRSVPINAGALATSGDYERYFEQAGKRYFHILNPLTGWPVNGFQSVTVCAPSCLLAGGVTTVAMLKNTPAGKRYLEELGLPFIAVTTAGEVLEALN